MAEIENNVICEVHGNGIKSSWNPNPDKRICDVCDFKTFCNKTEAGAGFPSVP